MKEFITGLAEVLRENPYRVFLFISAIFVFASILFDYQSQSEDFWSFFIYSVVGSVWRYVEKDIRHKVLKTGKLEKFSLVVYQIGNLALVFLLLFWLGLIS